MRRRSRRGRSCWSPLLKHRCLLHHAVSSAGLLDMRLRLALSTLLLDERKAVHACKQDLRKRLEVCMAELSEVRQKAAAHEEQHKQEQSSQQRESKRPGKGDWMSKAEVQERLGLLEAQIAAQQARSRQESAQRVADAESRAAAAEALAARTAQVSSSSFSSRFDWVPSCLLQQHPVFHVACTKDAAHDHAGADRRTGRGRCAAAQRRRCAGKDGARRARRRAGAGGSRSAARAARRRGGDQIRFGACAAHAWCTHHRPH